MSTMDTPVDADTTTPAADLAPADLRQAYAQVQDLRAQLAAAAADLNAYRDRVRDTAIRVWSEQDDWCLPGLNRVLGQLDLEHHAPQWEVTIEVSGRFDYVRAESEEAAITAIQNSLQLHSRDEDGDARTALLTIQQVDARRESA